MTSGTSGEDDRFAELLDQYATAYRDAVADAFWQAHPCDEALRNRILDAHQGLLQLESFITKRVQQQAIDTPQDSQLGQWLRQPTHLGRFQIVRELGRGGFGIVYLANDPSLGRQVAIKLPRIESLGSQSLQNRFAKEAEIAAKLDHPHIVPVFEVGQNFHDIYIVSLYCPGTNLAQWLAENKQRLTQIQIVDLMIAICEAMGYCHQKNVLHRDLKPANVLLFPSPFASLPFLPRINDFGLAKVLESTLSETASSALVGTPLYMAPEQASSQFDKVCPATDVYGIGAVLYELLTGQPPFRGTIAEILDQIRGKLPTRPRAFDKSIPLDLETICLKCLAKRVEDRYASAVELLADLRAFQAGKPIQARRLSFAQTFGRYAARNPGLMTTSLLLVCACMAGIYLAATNSPKGTEPTPAPVAPTEIPQLSKQDLAARYEKYASDMRRAFDRQKVGKREEALQILNAYADSSQGPDLRSFSWSWLNARATYQPQRYEGLSGRALAADISSDMRMVAAGDSVGNVFVWTRSGELIKTFNYSKLEVTAVAFSHDSKLLATAGQDSQIHIWRTDTWESVLELGDFNGTITSVAWSPDNKQLVSGSRQKNVSVWSVPEATRVKRLREVGDTVRSVDWSQDGKWIAANIGTGTSLWQASNFQLAKHFPLNDFTLHGLKFSWDSDKLLTVGFNQKLYFIDLADLSHVTEFPTEHHMHCAGLSPDSRYVVIGTSTGRPVLWSAESMTEILSLDFSDATVRGCKFSTDSQHLLTVHEEQSAVKLWDLNVALATKELWPSATTLGWQMTANGIRTVSGTGSTRVAVMEPVEKTIAEIPGATQLAILSSDSRVVARMFDNKLEIWDTETQSLKHTLPSLDFRLVRLDLLAGGTRLLAHGDVGSWALYDVAAETIVAQEHSPSPYLRPSYCISADEQRMVVRGIDQDAEFVYHLRSVHDGTIEKTMSLPRGLDHIVGNQDLSILYAASPEGILVYDVVRDQVDSGRFHSRRNIRQLALSPDGQTLAVHEDKRGLILWDVRTGQELFPVLETAANMDQLRFLSNTQLICHRIDRGIDGILEFNIRNRPREGAAPAKPNTVVNH